MALERSTETVPDDAALVEAVRAGRREAFDTLVERYQRRATSIAYRLLGNLHDAMEVCQEAFVRGYRCLDTLKDPCRFGPWQLRIVTNLSLNFRRSRGPRLSLENCLASGERSRGEQIADTAASDERPTARLAALEVEEQIRAGLSKLPAQQRAALVLFSVEQLPQKEVAEILGCSVEAVKWHVFQARRKMKVRLADYL